MTALRDHARAPGGRERNDRDLRTVVQVSSAISLGFMAAFLHSLKRVSPDLRFEPGWGSLLWGSLAALFSWLFWNLVLQVSSRPGTGARRRLGIATLATVLAVATASGFGFALRGIGNRKLIEVAQGTAMAILFLAILGTALWRVGRFFEADSRRAELEAEGQARTDDRPSPTSANQATAPVTGPPRDSDATR